MSYNDTVSSNDRQSEKMKNNKMRQLKNIKGFTLVELIVVLLIVAILAAIAVPTFLAFMDRAKEKDYETNAAKCLASTQAALSEIFSDASNSFSIKKRESVRDLCDSEKKSTEFIVWTKSALDSKSVRALPEYIASYTIEKALYEEAGCYLAYDGEKWKVFNSNKAREEALAFLSPDNDKAIYMWPYKQDLAYYPEIGEGGGSVADDSDTVRVVNLNLDTTCLNYVYYAPKGSDGNSGLKTMKVIFWKDSAGTVQSTWTTEGGKQYFSYDDSTVYELHEERYPVNGWLLDGGNGTPYTGPSEVASYIYGNGQTDKTYTFNISLGDGGEFTVTDVYISKSAFSNVLSNASGVTNTELVSLSTIKNEKGVPANATRIDDTTVKDGFVYAWYDGNTFKWWTNAEHAHMPADCSGLFKGKTGVVKFSLAGFECDNVTNMSEMFASNPNLQEVTGIGVTGNLTNTSKMFNGCTALTSAELSGLTGSISSMSGMFDGCKAISSIDFNDAFDTSSVSDFSNVFRGCESATSIGTSGFDLSSAKNVDSMFEGCKSVTSIDAKSWNLRKVETMNATFKGCTSLTSLPTASITTSRQLKELKETFAGCYQLTTIDLSGISAGNVTTMEKMFSMEDWVSDAGFSSNNKLSTIKFSTEFDGANATSMASMFNHCNKLTSIEGIENVYTRKVTDMSYMFAYTDSLTELNIKSFDTSSVTNCNGMFAFDSSSNKLTKVYASKKFIIKNNDSQKVFASADGVNKLTGSRSSNAQSIKAEDSSGFDSARYARIDGLDGVKGYFILDDSSKVYLSQSKFNELVNGYVTDKVVHVETSRYSLSEVQYIPGVKDIESTTDGEKTDYYIFGWREGNTVYWWSDAETVYIKNCNKLLIGSSIKEFSFEGFDVSKLGSIASLFKGQSTLEKVTFGNMFYADSLTDSSNLFNGCTALKTVDMENFNAPKVTNMGYMFSGCSALTSLDLSSINMSKVTNDNSIRNMFNDCVKLTTIYANDTFDYSNKNVEMFANCSLLVGGSGTAYSAMPTTNNNSNQKKSKYACIDGGTTKPGYFTRKTD